MQIRILRTALGMLLAIASGLTIRSVAAQPSLAHSQPTVRVAADGRQLQMQWSGQIYTLEADELRVQAIEAVDCARAEVAERQVLSVQRFSDQAIAIDENTGKIAIAALLQECYETQVSVVFVIVPESTGFEIHPVQIPGGEPLPDDRSTYPLNGIDRLSYLDGSLLIQHSDASGSQALLVFRPSSTPDGDYAGCVYTRQSEGDRLCPDNRNFL